MAVEDEYYDPDDLDTSIASLGHEHPEAAAYQELATDLRKQRGITRTQICHCYQHQ